MPPLWSNPEKSFDESSYSASKSASRHDPHPLGPHQSQAARPKMSKELEQFTTDDLLAEIVRRRNLMPKSSEKSYCDGCKNFRPWLKREDAPEDYNACSRGHQMTFHGPRFNDDPSSSDWGFFRRVCEDRAMMTETEAKAQEAKLQKVWQRLYDYRSREEYAKGLKEA